jgi:ATP-dependent Clp endopeptidase proteolytic subunit ClpP
MPQHKFRIVAEAKITTMYVYDEIGPWGVTANAVAEQLDTIRGDINLRINSPGGDVFDGLAMYNLLRNHRGQVTVDIDGWAASAASVVAMAGDTINMAANSFLLIHQPWTVVGGNASDFRQVADQLESIGVALVDTYATRRGVDRRQVSAWVEEETLFSAAEAIDAGMVDVVTEDSAVMASTDLSKFRNVPQRVLEQDAIWRQPIAAKSCKQTVSAAKRKRYLRQLSIRR